MTAAPILETARLRLRPCDRGDVDALHALWTHPDVRRFLWDDRRIARDEAEAVVEASLDSFAERGFGQWVVAAANDPDPIGFCGLRPIGEGGEIELLYGFHPAHWGRGLATEAAAAVLGHAFGRLGLPAVAGRADSPNRASLRVLARLGMRDLGEWPLDGRPTRHFELSREAFRRRRADGSLSWSRGGATT